MNIATLFTLLKVMEITPGVPSYFLDLLFKEEFLADGQTIMFDKVMGDRRVAPYVMPTVEGKVMTNQGYTTSEFTPAYVKPIHRIDPTDGTTRQAGEKIGGSMSSNSRILSIIGKKFVNQRDMIMRRVELMATELVLTGKITVSGENYPTAVVDFQRNAAHTVTLTPGTTSWGTAGISIKDDINEWVALITKNSGRAPTRMTVTGDVLKIMLADAEIQKMLDLNTRGTGVTIRNDIDSGEAAQYSGKLSASLELWVYNDIYDLEDGNTADFMPAGTVVLTANAEGVRCYGKPMDLDCPGPMVMFPKMYKQDNPSGMFAMTQSSPLPILRNIDATFAATVL